MLNRSYTRETRAGTIIPQIAFSAALGGTNTSGVALYMTFTPLGSNTVINAGSWS
jgi:hypothetical protein